MTVTIEGVPIPLISLKNLLTNKREVGRLRGLADVEELEKLEGSNFR